MKFKIIKNKNHIISLHKINSIFLNNNSIKIFNTKKPDKIFFDIYISKNIKKSIYYAKKYPSRLYILKTKKVLKNLPENIFLIHASIKNYFNFNYKNIISFSYKLKECAIRKIIIKINKLNNFNDYKFLFNKIGFSINEIDNKKINQNMKTFKIIKYKNNSKIKGLLIKKDNKLYYIKSLWIKKSNITNKLIKEFFSHIRKIFLLNDADNFNLKFNEKEIFLGNHISEGLFVFDLSGKIILFNKMFEKMFNLNTGNSCINQIQNIINQIKIKELLINWNNNLLHPIVYDEAVIMQGCKNYYSVTYSPILKNNKINNICGVIRDITLQKKIENELKISNINTALMNKKLISVQNAIIHGFSKLSEYKDKETSGHLERIQNYVKILSYELYKREIFLDFKTNKENYLSEDYVEEVSVSSLLHDIGKVGIPDNILLKPDRLTQNEFELMQMHTSIGGDTLKCMDAIVGEISILALAKDIAYYHHEKWNGSGYPFQMRQKQIPLCARIVSLCDVYDALTTDRPYKFSYSHEKACEIIYDQAELQFDPVIVTVFSTIEKQFKKIRNRYSD